MGNGLDDFHVYLGHGQTSGQEAEGVAAQSSLFYIGYTKVSMKFCELNKFACLTAPLFLSTVLTATI